MFQWLYEYNLSEAFCGFLCFCDPLQLCVCVCARVHAHAMCVTSGTLWLYYTCNAACVYAGTVGLCVTNIPMILLGVGKRGRLIATEENKSLPVILAVKFPLYAHLCMHLPFFGLRKTGGEISDCSGQNPIFLLSPLPPITVLQTCGAPPFPLLQPAWLDSSGLGLPLGTSCSSCQGARSGGAGHALLCLYVVPVFRLCVVPVFRCPPQDLWLRETGTSGGGGPQFRLEGRR